jgi:hypothetical protein
MEAQLWGGSNSRINAVPLESTAFGIRDSLFTVFFLVLSEHRWDPSELALLESFYSAFVDHTPGPFGLYRNCVCLRSCSPLTDERDQTRTMKWDLSVSPSLLHAS